MNVELSEEELRVIITGLYFACDRSENPHWIRKYCLIGARLEQTLKTFPKKE